MKWRHRQQQSHTHRRRTVAVLAAAAVLGLAPTLSACGRSADGAVAPDAAGAKPATVLSTPGSDVKIVVLTSDAANRVGIETAAVRQIPAPGGGTEEVIPVSAVYYDGSGGTWVYTCPTPLHYVRASVQLGPITADTAVLAKGPSVGTLVVTVGEAELYGVEYGVGGEQ